MLKCRLVTWIFISKLLFLSITSQAESARDALQIAVASNFRDPFEAIAKEFEKETGIKVVGIFGSTGKLYAQIVNGAPFQAFLAADRERPETLEKQGRTIPASRFTYAIGKLVLWYPTSKLKSFDGTILSSPSLRYLAIANPDLAPYGLAAKQFLEKKELWSNLQKKVVKGENIGQTFHFVRSGAAEMGLIALSQTISQADQTSGQWWLVPQEFYDPIEQQAVLLKSDDAARRFLAFLSSSKVRQLISGFGYESPADANRISRKAD